MTPKGPTKVKNSLSSSLSQQPPLRLVKVAVIGSGLAGLTVAYSIAQHEGLAETQDVRFEVHLFEKASSLGMDASSISIPLATNRDKERAGEVRVDVPMRSFQGGYYPQLISLYRRLGVQFQRADFTYSFSSVNFGQGSTSPERPKTKTTMLYNGQNGRRGLGIPSEFLPSDEKNPLRSVSLGVGEDWLTVIPRWIIFALWTIQLLISYSRLLRLSSPLWRKWSPPPKEESLAEWTERTKPICYLGRWFHLDRTWENFIANVVLPLFSAVCTAPEEDIWAHPVSDILDYIWKGLFTPHYVVTNGVQDVVDRLTQPLNPQHIHLSSPITSITPDPIDPSTVTVHFSNGSSSVRESLSGFSHVIFATQANHAAGLLTGYLQHLPLKSEQSLAVGRIVRCLSTFKYRPNVVINHTDSTMLPLNRQDWRDLNLFSTQKGRRWSSSHSKPTSNSPCLPPSFTMATHIISPLSDYEDSALSISPTHVYQTTNPIFPPNPDAVISVAKMERAVLTIESKEAVKQLCVDRAHSGGEGQKSLGTLQGAARRLVDQRSASEGESDQEGERWNANHPGIWLCGSYAYPGIPLLEGCVGSARNVVENGVLASEGIWVDKF